jgi:ATP-dependent DNA helicase RecG
VIEVGIDIPNASIIVIEGAERFGLAQLHQLRGRVGRSGAQSYCVLFISDGVPVSSRLDFFAKTRNGMELAEFDFRLRGPGNIYGIEQHGESSLKVANLFDYALVSKTKEEAEKIAASALDISIQKKLSNLQREQVAKD